MQIKPLLALLAFCACAVRADVLVPVPSSHLQPALPGAGTPRVVTQLMWDAGAGKLMRARFELWDVLELEDAELVWRPEAFNTETVGATGQGRLVWMQRGAAAYEAGAEIATLTGHFRAGRLEGEGRYWHRSGASYSGDWRDGRFHGQGRLQRADGTVYTGAFETGLPHGEGQLISRDGTIHTGRFFAGMRDGKGTVFPAQDRAYHAAWSADAEVSARRMISGDAGIAHIIEAQQPAYTDAALGISVNKARPERAFGTFEPLYDSFTQDGIIYVYPGAFADQWHGSAQSGLKLNSEFGWANDDSFTEASFNLDFQNKGVAPLTIVGGRIQVAQSQTDLDPALAIEMQPQSGGQWWCSSTLASALEFTSYGWSDPLNASINGGFLSADKSRYVLSIQGAVPPTWPASVTDLRGPLAQAGVSVPTIEATNLSCPSDDYEACFASVRNAQMFGPLRDALYLKANQIFATIAGTIDYEWRNNAGTPARKSQNFSAEMHIASFDFEPPCGEGSEYMSLYDGMITLPTDLQNYEVPFPINQTVQAGALQRWTFQIDSERSTRHIFQVIFQLSDGREIATRTVDLNLFKPRDPYRQRY